jgi:hypothetical protein
MGILRTVELGTFVSGTLNADGIDLCEVEARADPTREVLIGGHSELVIQRTVVECRDDSLQALTELIDFTTGK